MQAEVSLYQDRLHVLELALKGYKNKNVLELGCGGGEIVESLKGAGARVKCVDIDKRHKSRTHAVGSATEASRLFKPRSFDCIVALALFGSPFARWCATNDQDLRANELRVLEQMGILLKNGGYLLLYNADVWLPHLSTLSAEDFEREGFEVAGTFGNDTFLLKLDA